MKFVHFTPDYNFLRKFVLPIARYQQKMGDEVDVASHAAGKSKGSSEDSEAMEHDADITFHSLCLKPKSPDYIFSLIKLFRMLLSTKPDVIFLHSTTLAFFPLILVSIFFPNIVRIYINHGVPFIGYSGLVRFVLKNIELTNLRLAHHTYTVSKSMQSILMSVKNGAGVEVVGAGSACGVLIPYDNIKDLEQARKNARASLGIDPDAKVLLYVGRPVARKGLWDLISAWQNIRDIFPIKIYLVGPSLHDLEIRGIRSELDLHVMGYQENPELFFLAADILCVPSYHEGLGYTYIEAATFGCVPICSNIPGPTDFVEHNITGLTVQPGNVPSIVEQIMFLCNNPVAWEELSKRAFLEAKRYDRSAIVEDIALNMKRAIATHCNNRI